MTNSNLKDRISQEREKVLFERSCNREKKEYYPVIETEENWRIISRIEECGFFDKPQGIIPSPSIGLEEVSYFKNLIENYQSNLNKFITDELKKKIENNKDLKTSLRKSIVELKKNIDYQFLEADLEKDIEDPDFQKIVLKIEIEAESIEKWQDTKEKVRNIVRNAEEEDIMIFTRIFRT